VNKKLRTLLLVALLLVVALALSGCMKPTTGPVDLNQPVGLWNTIVYALAKVLIAINDFIANLGIPYSWGWAIIIFTIAIKLITLPLTFKQLQSAKAQQMMQPKLRELQEKYGKDKQKLSEEQMKLYKEAGINPLGGCLPLLIQMPILFALYQALYVLAGSGHLKNAPFFWIPDLSLPGSTAATAGVIDGIPMIGTTWISTAFKQQNWYVLFAYMSLPIFMLLTQMLLQKMSQPAKDPKTGKADSQTQMMGQMMFLMPVMFFWITLGLPAGLTLYWSVSNVLGMVQQYFVTGWGSLPDWFGFLKKPQPATVAITASSMPAPTAVPATTDPVEKPMKRRKRRK
jgi:YidC/Oxa1 family membrane protein insertase